MLDFHAASPDVDANEFHPWIDDQPWVPAVYALLKLGHLVQVHIHHAVPGICTTYVGFLDDDCGVFIVSCGGCAETGVLIISSPFSQQSLGELMTELQDVRNYAQSFDA